MVELLAPVGSKEAFYAAIENHTDAVYLGGKSFGARAYANNFSNEELKEMIDFAHLFDVKVYVTVNTIVYDEEIDELIEFLDFLYLNNCDAVIVQDLGVLNILRTRYKDFEVHASTQMNVHSVEQAKVLKDLGVKRIVVAREISIDEIKRIKKEVDIEIEVFIHGALCVSCSGNCYFSSLIGKRSGNRGRCAQPCRLSYNLKGEEGYMISPRDLYSIPRIKELIESNVDSLKIEGRMKRPEYVAQIIRSYRKAIDSYYNKTEFNIEKEERDLKTIFNREFTKGFLFDSSDSEYINTKSSNHIGILVGKVISSKNQNVLIKLCDEVSKGDSLRLVGEVTDAITINQMYVKNNIVTTGKSGEVIKLKSHVDNLENANVYLTTSSKQIEELGDSYQNLKRKLLISGIIDIDDDYLALTLEYNGKTYKKLSNVKVEEAKSLTSNDRILEQINKTNSTIFTFKTLKSNLTKQVFIPIKEVNELRRTALEDFLDVLKTKMNRKLYPLVFSKNEKNDNIKYKLKVKVRNKAQLDAVSKYNIDEIYVTDPNLINESENIRYFLPRIYKDIKYNSDKIVTSTLGNFKDFNTSIYMNVTNAYAVNLLESLGAKTIGLSLEMSIDQIESLIYNYKKLFNSMPNLELMVYGRYELMMLKYQMSLRDEDLYGNVNLSDRKGYNFPLLKENDNYIKVLNSKKVHLYDYLNKFKELNISVILDFTNENYEEVTNILEIYLNNSNKKIEDVTYGHIKEGVL